MSPSARIGVVIPCYKVAQSIRTVIEALPASVAEIIVVDDACPERSGEYAARTGREKVTVIVHESNQGVGGAVLTGYRRALELGCDLVVKIDGDGQMDASRIPELAAPLCRGEADFAKGNRFRDFQALRTMPLIRMIGNSGLSFLLKAASGYWNIMDPTNGYTAITAGLIRDIDPARVGRGYFFESSLLIEMNIRNAVVADVPMPAIYGDETSSLRIGSVLARFPFLLLKGLVRRVFLKYYVYDFNMASIYMFLGVPLFLLSSAGGLVAWIDSILTGVPRSAGTIMLIALPIIISFQMLLQAIQIDINSVPDKPRYAVPPGGKKVA